MQLEIVSRDFELTQSIREHIETRLATLSAWSRRDIRTVRVTLGDMNGPRGGADKYCKVSVTLRSGPDIRVGKVSDNLYDAITRAALAAVRTTSEMISRRRRRWRRSRRSLGLLF